jgi:L-alanine-DL-glutamate epimerase-like enolase superfamily enzyme
MTAIAIDTVEVTAHTVPTDAPESDGTFTWNSTTIVVVQVGAGGEVGVGWTYEHHAAATLITDLLADVVLGGDTLQVRARWHDMVHAVRNVRLPGIAAYAIAAVDTALWDLKARLLERPLVEYSTGATTPSRCTAAEASRPTTSAACADSWPAGSTRASPA